MLFRALRLFVFVILLVAIWNVMANSQPAPPFHIVRGESSAAMWLGTIENNFPNYPEERAFLRARHKLMMPWNYAHEDSIPTPEDMLATIDLYVVGAAGKPVRAGIPIPDDANLEGTVASCAVGALVGQARVEAIYPDGTARWVTIVLPATTPSGWVKVDLSSKGPPLSNPVRVSSTSGGVKVDTWTEGPMIWRSFTNMTPTGTIQGGSQPNCRDFGAPEERTANVDGASIRLRAGEQVEKVTDPTRPGWCSTSWYRRAADSAFLGPVAVLDQSGPRQAFLNISLAGMTDRALHDGLKPGTEALRDLGDLSADHEGPLESVTKWRNNEYGIVDAFWRCFCALVGEPGSVPDPRTADVWEAAKLAGRHQASVDVYHLEAGPLSWIWGAVWQHCEHGGGCVSNPHRGAAPNTGHFCTSGTPIVRYALADPVMDETCDLVQRRTRWKIENGPGMPGIPDTKGEDRAPANLLRIMLEARLDQPADSALYRAAAERVISEGISTRTYVPGGQKVKPWMAALLLEEVGNAVRQGGIAGAVEQRARMIDAMVGQWIIEPNGPNSRLIYQVNPEEESNPWSGFWNLLAADVLVETHPGLAARLYETGSTSPWYESNKVEWIKTLSAAGVIEFGHRFAGAR